MSEDQNQNQKAPEPSPTTIEKSLAGMGQLRPAKQDSGNAGSNQSNTTSDDGGSKPKQ